MAIRYITNADGKGWLMVRYSNNTTYPPLPQLLKVDHRKIENGRDYFIIMVGRNKGKSTSVNMKNRLCYKFVVRRFQTEMSNS